MIQPAAVAVALSLVASSLYAQNPCARNRLVLANAMATAQVPSLTAQQKPLFDGVVAALRRNDQKAATQQFQALSKAYFGAGGGPAPCPLVHAIARRAYVDPSPAVSTDMQAIRAASSKLGAQLETVGDDAQLANVDLQNVLQKQQQTLQMMSTIEKLLHDTAMAVIRKIGG